MNWEQIIQEEKQKDYFKNIINFLMEDGEKHKIYPNHKDIFNAFKYCSYDDVKFFLLGQDPYHGPGQAHGLSFSVIPGVAIPPSLQNIFKELKADLNINLPRHGCLIDWAKQGLLLNSFLTVREGQPGSHQSIGWQIFTDKIISSLNKREKPLVFILWGAHSKNKINLITNKNHLILTGSHPSPLSANKGGFFGGKYFSKTNDFLIKNNIEPINWSINNYE